MDAEHNQVQTTNGAICFAIFKLILIMYTHPVNGPMQPQYSVEIWTYPLNSGIFTPSVISAHPTPVFDISHTFFYQTHRLHKQLARSALSHEPNDTKIPNVNTEETKASMSWHYQLRNEIN